MRNGRDISPFVPSVAITYDVITSTIAFPSAAALTRSAFDENRDQAVTARHSAEFTLPAVNKHDSPFIASMDEAHVMKGH
jgi:hypothetical protein